MQTVDRCKDKIGVSFLLIKSTCKNPVKPSPDFMFSGGGSRLWDRRLSHEFLLRGLIRRDELWQRCLLASLGNCRIGSGEKTIGQVYSIHLRRFLLGKKLGVFELKNGVLTQKVKTDFHRSLHR
ncbi:hypothetical protein N9009_00570 [bacterium]|nr:hypothetical protein [bacterium]